MYVCIFYIYEQLIHTYMHAYASRSGKRRYRCDCRSFGVNRLKLLIVVTTSLSLQQFLQKVCVQYETNLSVCVYTCMYKSPRRGTKSLQDQRILFLRFIKRSLFFFLQFFTMIAMRQDLFVRYLFFRLGCLMFYIYAQSDGISCLYLYIYICLKVYYERLGLYVLVIKGCFELKCVCQTCIYMHVCSEGGRYGEGVRDRDQDYSWTCCQVCRILLDLY
eukprot:TRINITY_DN1436_c0_g1_i2.p3 TRINITY_DN1436_c0_g1~~TRINITY_DN1436_c0_g1_i2.p3  ORF type:complete len:218 (-),score=-12.27 TRINITY_DN1436_c0_g1_i2:420-1073(-)